MIIKGTRYAWNISRIGDQACLERFSMGTRHAWNVWKFVLYEPRSLLVQTDWTNKFTFSLRIFWANQIGPKVYEVRRKRILKFWNVPGMSSPHRKAFQACLVPNSTDVPGIPGPYFYQRSRHTWSPLLSMFQAYLVPIITDVPCIPSPPDSTESIYFRSE